MATVSSPESALRRHRLSVAAYERMAEVGILGPESRVELIAGELLDMSPIGSLHAAVVSRLARDFIVAIGAAAVVRIQDPLRIDDFNEPQPDLVILAPREDFYSAGHPGPGDTLLVVEVADSSLAHDLNTKAAVYAQAGIPEYWVVDLAGRGVVLFSDPRGSGYETRRTHRTAALLHPLRLPACGVDPLAMLREP